MLLPFLFFLALAISLAQENPYKNDPTAAEAGRGMYRIYCAPCHGIKAEGGRGPDLTRGVYNAGETDADLHRIIMDGSSGTEMPGFSQSLGSDQIWRLVSYVRSVTRRDTEPVSGNIESGEKLFWGKGGCGGCHRVGTRGGRMGPDLSLAGRMRSLKYLRESLLDPNDDITPGFPTVTVVTKDGRKLTGVQRNYDNFSAQFMDAQEKFHSYLKSDVQSMTREFKSLMPSYAPLPKGDIDDLVAYLHHLGRTR